MSEQVKVTDGSVVIEHLECREPGVVEFFADVAEDQRVDTARHAVAVGVAGLRTMNARADVEQVERGFEQLKRQFEQAFDPERKTSYLGQFADVVDGYFGEDGAMVAALSANGEQVMKAILEQVVQLRDVVVGKIASAEEREKGTAKGADFEGEVESVLCRLAKAYGDTVINVSAEAGEAGRSKKGDFVVVLAEGQRFTVEAKNKTTSISLRGGNGILPALNGSMVNRQAAFAIAVSKCAEALPKEVGAFNEYDGDKLVCAFGDDGLLLEVAYRWARAQLLSELDSGVGEVDVDALRTSLADVKDSVSELAKVKAKATAIVKNANDIQHIVDWQVAQARASLAQAEQALDVRAAVTAIAS